MADVAREFTLAPALTRSASAGVRGRNGEVFTALLELNSPDRDLRLAARRRAAADTGRSYGQAVGHA